MLCIRYCRIPTGQIGSSAYPGESRGRNVGRPDSTVMRVWVSGRCRSNRRSANAAGETDNSNFKIKSYGYGIGKFAEDYNK